MLLASESCHTPLVPRLPHALAACPRYMQSQFCCVGGANCVKLAFTVTRWHMWRSSVHQRRVSFQHTVAESGFSNALPKLCKKHSWSDSGQMPEVSGCLFQWTSPQYLITRAGSTSCDKLGDQIEMVLDFSKYPEQDYVLEVQMCRF